MEQETNTDEGVSMDTTENSKVFEQMEECKPQSEQIEEVKPQSGQMEEVKPQSEQLDEAKPQSGQMEEVKPQSEPMEEGKLQSEQMEEVNPQSEQMEDVKPQSEQLEEIKPQSEQMEEVKPQSEQMEEGKLQSEQLEEVKPQSEQLEEVKLQSEHMEEVKQQSEQMEEVRPQSEQMEEGKLQSEQMEEVKPQSGQVEEVKLQFEQLEEVKPQSEQMEEVKPQSEQMEEVKLQSEQLEEVKPQSGQMEEGKLQSEQMEEVKPQSEQLEEVKLQSEQMEEVKPQSEQMEEVKLQSEQLEEVKLQSDNFKETSETLERSDAVKEVDKERVTPSGAAGKFLSHMLTKIQDNPAVRPKLPTVNLESLNSVESPDEGLTYEFSIKFIVDMSGSDISDGTLLVSKMYGLLFGGSRHVQIPFKCIRWFAEKQKLSHHNECFVLSYEDVDSTAISYIFFVCHELDSQLVEQILVWKLAEADGSSAMKTKHERDQVLKILQQQPYELGMVKLNVTPKQASNMNGETLLTNTMVLDIECVSFFQGSTDKPAHQIKFWVEEGEDVVETIKVIQANSKIEIETTRKYFVLVNASMQVTDTLKRMRAREKHLFLGIENLLKVVEYAPIRSSQNTGIPNTSSFNLPSQSSDWEESGSFRAADTSLKIEFEMKDALNSLGQTEDFQLQWIVLQSELDQLLMIGAIQETEIQSGGLDPNNVDHLERALIDAGDQLKDSPDLALSRIQAARKLFTMSGKASIRNMFSYDDMELLKMLYYRSLMQ